MCHSAPRKLYLDRKLLTPNNTRPLKNFRWSQLKRNINVETGRNLMRELGSHNNEIATALKVGLNKSTLKSNDCVADTPSKERSASPSTWKKRPSGTSTLESLLLHSPDSVKIYRKFLDRKSGKPLFKPAKF